ncbi:hypothetical protein [Streptomyces fructofermentans]|uniref:Uncharacterized protein n=1 Tax=Streptomyces fructofermentans TaxID=152141 RepID=A0A918K213_9ACTN|nr:hypothetical protein [Streptomyces fructofermentans]GGX40881.1 hypothetical protein GCM10010515_04650 [Streptomyces fructofermentans]
MNTFLGYLTVLFVAAVLVGPALVGLVRERGIDRRIRAAADRSVPAARVRRALVAHDVARAA